MKLGSLFDGSGGFPLAGAMCGIEPVWASEVEPYPIAVTKSRFPNMKHLGNVCEINGAEIEPVDIITFGSPCQGLSQAGLQKGLADERSGLFMEAVLIIKELREATNGRYPTYAVWENVPGAFSSNGGQDFRTVLEELIRIAEPSAVIPDVPKGGWAYADWYMGDRWSVAYRVLDAQFWGVPQRRRRIYLVLDLGGERAGKILFKREGLRGYFAEGRTPWQGAAADAQRCVGADDRAGEGFDGYNGDLTGTVSATLGVNCGVSTGRNGVIETKCYGISSYESNAMKSANPHSGIYEAQTSRTLDLNGGNPACNQGGIAVVCYDIGEARLRTPSEYIEQSPTITARCGTGGNNVPAIVQTYDVHKRGINAVGINGDIAGTLDANYHKGCGMRQGTEREVVAYQQTSGALCARDYKGVGSQYVEEDKLVVENMDNPKPRYIVRRLTPTECARLQGFPDKWGHPDYKDSFTDDEYAFWTEVRVTHAVINGKQPTTYSRDQMVKWYNNLHTDSAEYKMWGNGIALPTALYVMQGIAETEEQNDGQVEKHRL